MLRHQLLRNMRLTCVIIGLMRSVETEIVIETMRNITGIGDVVRVGVGVGAETRAVTRSIVETVMQEVAVEEMTIIVGEAKVEKGKGTDMLTVTETVTVIGETEIGEMVKSEM